MGNDGTADGAVADPAEVAAVAAAAEQLGAFAWPGGYAETGLAILDAIWSPGAVYESTVEAVVRRYRAWRTHADEDTACDLVEAVVETGGPDAFATLLENRQRTSPRGGILKAEAVAAAAAVVASSATPTVAAFGDATDAQLEALRCAWCKVHGQSSGITYRYFLMLVGVDNVKPDRMVRRFLEGTLHRNVEPTEAVALVAAAASQLGCRAVELDHRIWRAQRRRR